MYANFNARTCSRRDRSSETLLTVAFDIVARPQTSGAQLVERKFPRYTRDHTTAQPMLSRCDSRRAINCSFLYLRASEMISLIKACLAAFSP